MRDTGWGARFLDSVARTVNASTAWRQRARVVLTAGGHMGINMNKFGITALSATALLGSLALMNAAHAQSTWNVYSGSNGGSGCAQNATNSGNCFEHNSKNSDSNHHWAMWGKCDGTYIEGPNQGAGGAQPDQPRAGWTSVMLR